MKKLLVITYVILISTIVNANEVITTVAVSNLEPIAIDSLGIDDSFSNNISPNLWQKSDIEIITFLLNKYNPQKELSILNKITHKILAAQLLPPKMSENDKGLFLKFKIHNLLKMNKFDDAGRILEMVPQEFKDEDFEKFYVEYLIKARNINQACKQHIATHQTPEAGSYWDIMRIICYTYYGDETKKDLSITTLKEEKKEIGEQLEKTLKDINKANFSNEIENIYTKLAEIKNMIFLTPKKWSYHNSNKWQNNLTDNNINYLIRSYQYSNNDDKKRLFRFMNAANIDIPASEYYLLSAKDKELSDIYLINMIEFNKQREAYGEMLLWINIFLQDKKLNSLDDNIKTILINAIYQAGFHKEANELVVELMKK